MPFANSPTFHARSSSIVGLLERDLDGDGLLDVVAAERGDLGFGLVVYMQEAALHGSVWRRTCASGVVPGDELVTLRFVQLDDASTVAVVVGAENPEESIELVRLVDVGRGCAERFAARVRLSASARGGVLAPPGLHGGVHISADGARVSIFDEPRYVQLAAVGGDVQLLTELRRRDLWVETSNASTPARPRATLAPIVTRETHLALLVPLVATIEWQSAGAAVGGEAAVAAAGMAAGMAAGTATAAVETTPTCPLTELCDANENTSFVARPSDDGALHLSARALIAVLEVHHGCNEPGLSAAGRGSSDDGAHEREHDGERADGGALAAAVSLTLQPSAGGEAVSLGEPAAEGTFVRAVGARRDEHGSRRFDLLALAAPMRELSLRVGPLGRVRCLREVKAYAWMDAAELWPEIAR